MSKWAPANEYVPVTKGSTAVITLQSDGDVYGYMDASTAGVLLASASAGVTKGPTGSFSKITCTTPFILTTESAMSRFRGGEAEQGYPSSYGTAKLFMTDDGKTVTFNFTEENPNGFPLTLSSFPAAETIQGDFYGLDTLYQAFMDNTTLKNLIDCNFYNIASAESAFEGSSIEIVKGVDFGQASTLKRAFASCANLSVFQDVKFKSGASLHSLFSDSAITSISNFDASSASNCYGVFVRSKLETITNAKFPRANVNNLFYEGTALTSCTDLTFENLGGSMFFNCIALTSCSSFKFGSAINSFDFNVHFHKTFNPQILTFAKGGLSAVTSFLLYNVQTAINDASIQNIVDTLPDWSGTDTTALVQFPSGRLTAEQQATLTAKGWTWSEATD